MSNYPVLVVEDDVLSGMETCDILREYGFEVAEVSDPVAAHKFLFSRQPISALVTDIDLGPGECGYDLARFARMVHPNLPVIYFSGSSASRQLTEGVPGSRFIAKPFFAHQVAETLIRLVYPGRAVAGCQKPLVA